MKNEMRNAKTALWMAGCMLTALSSAHGQAKYPAWNYPTSYDSVKAAPKNNKLLYEDDRLRFIEVTIAPNEKEPMNGDHTHRFTCTTRRNRTPHRSWTRRWIQTAH